MWSGWIVACRRWAERRHARLPKPQKAASNWPKRLPHPAQEISPEGHLLVRVEPSSPTGEVTLALPALVCAVHARGGGKP